MRLAVGVKVIHSGDLARAIAVDAKDFSACFQIEVAGSHGNGDRGVQRRRLGVDVATVEIAVTAINAGRPLRDTSIERFGWAIRLRENARGRIVRMITELRAGFSEQ